MAEITQEAISVIVSSLANPSNAGLKKKNTKKQNKTKQKQHQ